MSAQAVEPELEDVTCLVCGFEFRVPPREQDSRGKWLSVAYVCSECTPRKDNDRAYSLALAVTELRLAVAMASAALGMGRPDLARAALDHVDVPLRPAFPRHKKDKS